jgi:predicted DsbA family dithiol-disulfide isomerase
MVRKEINTDVASDPVYPWGYIEKRRLEGVIAERPDLLG